LGRGLTQVISAVFDEGFQSFEGGLPLARDFVGRCARGTERPQVEYPHALSTASRVPDEPDPREHPQVLGNGLAGQAEPWLRRTIDIGPSEDS
jgi:hypothetical protein